MKVFLKGKITQRHNCITKHFGQLLSTNWMANGFRKLKFLIMVTKYPYKKMCNIIFFWKIWVSYSGLVKKIILHIFKKKDLWPQKIWKLHLHSLHVFSLQVVFLMDFLGYCSILPLFFWQWVHGLHAHVFKMQLFHYPWNMK